MKDYYKILGINKNASDDDIKQAYRKLAHQYHPDRPTGDEGKFKEINEAYQILSNQEKRSQYDRFGQTSDGAGFNPFGGQNGSWEFGFEGFNPEDLGNMGDLFDTFFEGLGMKRRKTYYRGSDLEIGLEVSLEEAFQGAEKAIVFNTFMPCDECKGVGHFADAGFTNCSTCGGQGEIRETRSSFFGNFSQIRRCTKCLGNGQIPNKVCAACSSKGRVKSQKTAKITLTAGVRNGQIIKVAGAGEAGEQGAAAGDLYIRLATKPHPAFSVKDNDLIMEKEISILDAVAGNKIKINTISGQEIDVEIPSQSNLNQELKIPGEGMPHFGKRKRGDLYIKLNVKTPKKLSHKAKRLLDDLRGELD